MPSSKKIAIQINDNGTPWFNDKYYVYRQDSKSTDYVLIDSTEQTTYIDKGLKNNINYGYYITTRGQYLVLPTQPLLNNSQKAFAMPINTFAPPPPILSLNQTDCKNFVNILDWQNGTGDGDDIEDIVKYLLYFSPIRNGKKTEIATVINDNLSSTGINQFIHSSISLAGCYQVAAVDVSNNVSMLSNTICTDNCYSYSLPNIFTPNGDGKNDTFQALENKFVEKINITIYDRQGKTVFNAQDPNFIWDGRNYLTREMLSDGIYLYTGEVYFITLDGSVKHHIRGDITLISIK
jgi:gliding motility-associated-like protein